MPGLEAGPREHGDREPEAEPKIVDRCFQCARASGALAGVSKACPVLRQALENCRVAGLSCRTADDHHDVESLESTPCMAKTLPDQPADAVTRHRRAHASRRNGNAKTCTGQAGGTIQHGEKPIGGAPSPCEHMLEFSCAREFLSAGGTRGGIQFSASAKRSGRQLRATFGAASFQDQSATLGRHPGAKPVGSHALDLARLVSALHGEKSLRKTT